MGIFSTAVISLGSNTDDSLKNVLAAIKRLSAVLDSMTASEAYFTAPLSGKGADYCNAVVCGSTSLPASELQVVLKQIEKDAGRDESSRIRGDVPLDLDLVMFNGEILRPKDAERDYFIRGFRQLMLTTSTGE